MPELVEEPTAAERSSKIVRNVAGRSRRSSRNSDAGRRGGSGGNALPRRRALGLTRARYAELAGVSERTLATAEADGMGRVSRGSRRRLTELDRLLAALSDAVRPPALGAWLFEPNPAFEGRRPADALAAGEADRLWRTAYQLRSGDAF